MRDNSYQCDSCNRKFSRRSNANRHIKVVHMGNAIAFNKITGKSSTETYRHPYNSRMGLLPPGMDLGGLEDIKSSPEDEELLTEILEKIRKPFEDLESLVVNLDENSRARYLAETITSSFLTSDPVKIIQDTVDLTRTFKFKKKLVDYISRRNNTNNSQAQAILIEALKMGKYYRNRVKY